jgi:hypothetical protein
MGNGEPALRRIGTILATFAALAGAAHAAKPTTRPAVPAATPVQRANADAVSRLYALIAAESVGGVAVAQIIDRVDGHVLLMNGLARAEQVGGPRVVSDELVQVQLQIGGARAAQLLLQAVAIRPEKSPIPPDRLAFLLQDWNGRTFSTTGASLTPPEDASFHAMAATTSAATAAAPRVVELKLDAVPGWVNHPLGASAVAPRDSSALRTARAAERAAREVLMSRIQSLPVGETSLGDAARGDEGLREIVEDAVDAARIVGVDYRGDGSVEVRISLDGRQLWQAILASR